MYKIYGKAIHGKAVAQFKNGAKYDGDFHNGLMHSKFLLKIDLLI